MEKEKYHRLCRLDRVAIQQGIDPGGKAHLSARAIAKSLGRSPSTITSEIRKNRIVSKGCDKGKPVSEVKTPQKVCPKLEAWPYVCNGCRLRRYHCGYAWRCEYNAARADTLSHEKLIESRKGINRTKSEFEHLMAIVRADICRGLSPAQICAARSEQFRVNPSTLYRWIAAGYGGMSNLDLRRKVGYKSRKTTPIPHPTAHGKQRSYQTFSSLTEDRQGSAVEMDTVIGRACDSQCILTLYLRPCRFQLCILLPEKTSSAVASALDTLEGTIGRRNFKSLFNLILTDNGSEFSDTEAIERSLPSGRRCEVYYCDVRQSQQKARCERNHVELRKILPKGRGIDFDKLIEYDMAVLMSHLNSQPRPSLMGSTPLSVLCELGGRAGKELIEAYGICEIGFDALDMTPEAIEHSRAERGLPFLTR